MKYLVLSLFLLGSLQVQSMQPKPYGCGDCAKDSATVCGYLLVRGCCDFTPLDRHDKALLNSRADRIENYIKGLPDKLTM